MYDNQGCSSTPKQTIAVHSAVGVDTCVSISQSNISVKGDCSGGGVQASGHALMAFLFLGLLRWS
jgi:hypothetical protein